jgi:hypothetical protein
MGMPQKPVSLNPDQIAELNDQLSTMRHNANNHLQMILAAAEIMQHKPELKMQMITTLLEQPAKVITEINSFSREFEQTFGITRH